MNLHKQNSAKQLITLSSLTCKWLEYCQTAEVYKCPGWWIFTCNHLQVPNASVHLCNSNNQSINSTSVWLSLHVAFGPYLCLFYARENHLAQPRKFHYNCTAQWTRECGQGKNCITRLFFLYKFIQQPFPKTFLVIPSLKKPGCHKSRIVMVFPCRRTFLRPQCTTI